MDKRLRHLLTCATAENDRLRRELAELRADAERYREALQAILGEYDDWKDRNGRKDDAGSFVQARAAIDAARDE